MTARLPQTVKSPGPCRRTALEALDGAEIGTRPAWLYYLTPGHLESQAGYAYVHLGRARLKAGDRRGGRAALREGIQLLRHGPYDRALAGPAQRRPLYEGAWLALGHLAYGDVDEACRVAALAIPRLEKVASPRSLALRQTFAAELRRRHRNPYAADFIPDLERALENATGSSDRST